MTPELSAAFRAELINDEADRSKVYDDATGKPIIKGTVVMGNPTVGIGRNLASRGLRDSEIEFMYSNDALECEADLAGPLPWIASLSIPRQVAVYSLYFNMDLGTPAKFIAGWPHFLAQMQAGDYDAAATNLETSQPWATEVGARATRLGEMVRQG